MIQWKTTYLSNETHQEGAGNAEENISHSTESLAAYDLTRSPSGEPYDKKPNEVRHMTGPVLLRAR